MQRTAIGNGITKELKRNYDLYLLILPVVAYYVIFAYIPMYGIQLAFKDFFANLGIWGSPFVGLQHFKRFFNMYNFSAIMSNTLGISLYSLAVGFPCNVILALMINEIGNKYFKKTVQLVTYAPHFISTVVMVGMLMIFVNPRYGPINQMIGLFGVKPIAFMNEPSMFKSLYVFSGVWQNVGFGSIIYLAALSAIDLELHEAATIDGASRLQRIWHINIPGITPTMVIMLILAVGGIMNVGFEKVFLMQNDLNRSASDVISTYVYRTGLTQGEYSFGTAVGLFNSVVNLILIVTVNAIANRVGEGGLW